MTPEVNLWPTYELRLVADNIHLKINVCNDLFTCSDERLFGPAVVLGLGLALLASAPS